jgi:CRP-like cAMP-binding protein
MSLSSRKIQPSAALSPGNSAAPGGARAERLWYLKNCRLLERLPAEELAQLEKVSRFRKFAAGEMIYTPTAAGDAVLVLTSGRVKICHLTPDGKESILALIEPGELFGELCLFEQGPREDFAIAVAAAAVVLVPRQSMQELLERNAGLAIGVTRLVGLRRQRIERRLKYLLYRSNHDRLIHLLAELAETYGVQTPAGVLLSIKLSHQDLASIIGSTRETVTATLGQLQKLGLLEIGRQKIVIRDVGRLAGCVDQGRGGEDG